MNISCHTPEDMLKRVSWWSFNDSKPTRSNRFAEDNSISVLPRWDRACHIWSICVHMWQTAVGAGTLSQSTDGILCKIFVECLWNLVVIVLIWIIYNNVRSYTEWIKGKGLARIEQKILFIPHWGNSPVTVAGRQTCIHNIRRTFKT